MRRNLDSLLRELEAAGLGPFIAGFDRRRWMDRAELARLALASPALPVRAATLLLQEAIFSGDLASVEALLARGAHRCGPCFGMVNPTDVEECHMCCERHDPCMSCRLDWLTYRTRRRSRRISDWLWARCACSRLWSGKYLVNDWGGPGHPVLQEILSSPELPKVARWLGRACEHEEDRLGVEDAVQQCGRWEPRAAWVAAVLRARPRPAGAASGPK